MRARLDFANRYRDWTQEDWKHVVFSDETKINRLGSDGCKWVWKRSKSSILPQHVCGTLKFGGGGLMLWGCMTATGIEYACRIEGHMGAKLYTKILGGEFIWSLDLHKLAV